MSESSKLAFVHEEENKASTLVELLRRRASEQPARSGYTYLADGDSEELALTYSELDARAKTIAATLQKLNMKGERALLLYPPGLDFIVGFFGCLYAGVIAVPAYPPDPNQLARNLKRLQAIINDAQAKVAITTGGILRKVEKLLEHAPALKALHWLASDTIASESDAGSEWLNPDVTDESIAFLQYTSGSTGAPKGVMLTHGNLLHNAKMVYHAFSHTATDKYISWLPTFHDMGLMAGVLQPLYGGFPVVLMSPISFLQNPFKWLQAITRYRGTTSGGPNFAYDLCLRKINAEQRATLDLSSWTVAFNGAEPVRQETLERFAATFASCGFRKEALFPCYGLAEATLIVSGGIKTIQPIVKRASVEALENHRIMEADESDAETRPLVSSGRALVDEEIAIVHPKTLKRCQPHEVGEIWVASPSVGKGYWNRPAETEQTFGAYITDTNEGPFLRTGDLGFLQDGELFVTGRHKDLIIIRGHNHYPQDIELTMEQSHPALRKGCGAAFTVDVDGEERLVVVQEIDARRQPDVDEVYDAIRASVSENHELQVYAIALLKPGSVPKTSSGKIQRRACRAGFLKGELEEIERSTLDDEADAPEETEESFIRRALLSSEAGKRQPLMEAYLLEQIAPVLKTTPARLRSNRPLTSFGLDSLAAVELKNRIDVDLKLSVPLTTLLDEGGVAQLAKTLLEQLNEPSASDTSTLLPPPPPVTSQKATAEETLSFVQESIWFLHQLAPESAAYNVAFAARIRARVDAALLRRALQALVNRHPSLRTKFLTREGEPVQLVQEGAEVDFEETDASAFDASELNERTNAEAHVPFDLERGEVFRARLFKCSDNDYVLLLTAHHIAIDGWSFWVLLDDLRELYASEKNHTTPALPSLPFAYTDYTRWQRDVLAGAQGERLWNYWQKELSGELPVLKLPTFRARPRVQTFSGTSHAFALDSELTRRLQSLAKAESTTLYTVLVAAFQVLLHRYTGQEDILIGSPASGRSRAEFENIVGCFFNAVVLRANLSGDPPFNKFLRQVRGTVLGALAHQDYPSHLLARRLQPNREPGQGQLFQVSFILQQPHRPAAAQTFAGNPAHESDASELRFEFFPLQRRSARSELELELIEADGGFNAWLHFNTDLFESELIARMAAHFQMLLDSVAADAGQRISRLSLLTHGEREQLLSEWSTTHADYSRNVTAHELFEEQAAKTPKKVASVAQDGALTFEEINEEANKLANLLTEIQR
ncbi:MAG TPA: condensation domain-containing protein [Pyrinomonadaceae bacterium]|jgi:acyl-CoA synthetase (AMP-forming)/AMP-acid ligase II